MGGSVLLIGLGDLGWRLAEGLASAPWVGELVLASRRVEEGEQTAALLAACGQSRVRFRQLDAGRPAEVERVLREVRPDLVIQCGVAISPWQLWARRDPAAAAVVAGGLVVQLPSQLYFIANVMRAVRSVGLSVPVLNASFPDLTHPVLAAAGLAPTVGLGNAGMIRLRARANLLAAEPERASEPVRVLAHHAHLMPTLQGKQIDGVPRPRVYLGEEGRRADDLATAGTPLPRERSLNALTAASGLPIARALLGDGPPLRTSAPGPNGLHGGFPVLITGEEVSLDLPPGLDLEEALAFQAQSARADGVERLEDGTVFFTEEAQAAVRPIDPALAEPMSLAGIEDRLRLLRDVLGLA